MRLLGVDQSLSNTGWALLECRPWDTEVMQGRVVETGMIVTEPDIDIPGFEGSFQRATALFQQMRYVIDRTKADRVVHEMPGVLTAGMPSRNREAAPAACMAVRCAVQAQGRKVTMLNAQKVKHVLTGNVKAKKLEVREALMADPNLVWSKDVGPMNEHTTDAVALAWVHATKGEN